MKVTPKQMMNERYGTGTWANMVALLDACRALEAEGHSIEGVNRSQLAAVSGVTANNEIAAGKQLYKRRRELLNTLPETPTEVAEIVLRSVNTEFVKLQEQFQDEILNQQTAFEEALTASGDECRRLSDLCDHQKAQSDKHQNQMSALQKEIQNLQETNELLVQQNKQAMETTKLAEISRERCRGLLRKRRFQIRRAEERYRQEQVRQTQIWAEQKTELRTENEKALDRLSQELETVRQERKATESELREKIATQQDELSSRQRSLHQQTDQTVKLSMECDKLREHLADMSEKYENLKIELQTKLEESQQLIKKSESLQIELDILRNQANQLQSLSTVLYALERRLDKNSSDDELQGRQSSNKEG